MRTLVTILKNTKKLHNTLFNIVHLFCPECGKHIDVSLEEIDKQHGHLVCPQCLASIEVEVKGNNIDFHDKIDDKGTNNINVTPVVPTQVDEPEQVNKPTATQPVNQPVQQQQVQHVDDVLRYCKKCGAFLREGANFCPKCGEFVKVTPPKYKGLTSKPPKYTPSNSANRNLFPPHHQNQQQNTNMATTQRNYAKSKTTSKARDNKANSGIFSIGGCLTLTLITVALFFIAYIVMGYHLEG